MLRGILILEENEKQEDRKKEDASRSNCRGFPSRNDRSQGA